MEKYVKDNNGQAASSINGAISGKYISCKWQQLNKWQINVLIWKDLVFRTVRRLVWIIIIILILFHNKKFLLIHSKNIFICYVVIRVTGLFFSARLLPDGSLPTHSPFGNVRMLVPAMTLLDPARVNMYFCDFYCNYITHYVTVVICEKHSDVSYISFRLLF